jgi:hypothetical protein
LADIRSGRAYIRGLFKEAFQWIDTWLQELKEIIAKDSLMEEGLRKKDLEASAKQKELEEKRKRLDANMTMACNLHAHAILMLRNIDLGAEQVARLLSSFSFLSMHHTFNMAQGLDIPEPELFEIYHRHRRHVVRWFEERMEKKEYRLFNDTLRTVHTQFSSLDSSNAVNTKDFEWGAVGGDDDNAGRFCIVGPKRTDAERGEITSVASDKTDTSWLELNVQLLQVSVRGRHVAPLEEDISANPHFADVLKLKGREAKTVQCAALLTTDQVRVRELLSFPFRTLAWGGRTADSLPAMIGVDRIYDVEDLDASEAFIWELFEPVRRQFFVRPVVPKDILFFLREDVPEDVAVVCLIGSTPPCAGASGRR